MFTARMASRLLLMVMAGLPGVVLGVGGARRPQPASVSRIYDYKSWRQMAVSGHIRWQGDLAERGIEIRALAVPRVPQGDKKSVVRTVVTPLAQRAYYALDPLTTEGIEEVLTFRAEPRSGRVLAQTVTEYRLKVNYYIIELIPPPGWQVSPSSYRISRSNNRVDFLLTPVRIVKSPAKNRSVPQQASR